MIQANELRIGNLVEFELYENKVFRKIDYTDFEFIIDGELRCPNPIPLTEEWLLKFGFEKKISSTCTQWFLGKNQITNDWLFDLVWLEKPELINVPNAPFYKNGRHTILYVHQLQNLYFALTGEELTLK